MQARKLSFQEAWETATVFLVDESLEDEIDEKANRLLRLIGSHPEADRSQLTTNSLMAFLTRENSALDVVLYDIGLSVEKLLRIVSLLRRIGRVQGGFDQEWSIGQVKRKMVQQPDFARLIAGILMDGVRDHDLARYIPRYYLEMLDYRNLQADSYVARRNRYKRALIGSYGGKKGYRVEGMIRTELERI